MNTCLSFTYRLVTFFKNNHRYSHERKFLHNMQLRTLVRNMRNLFTNGKPKSSLLRNSIQRFPCVPGQIGIWKRWFKGERKTGKPREKKKTIGEGTRTKNKLSIWATLVEGENSHHCAIPAPPFFLDNLSKLFSKKTCYCITNLKLA